MDNREEIIEELIKLDEIMEVKKAKNCEKDSLKLSEKLMGGKNKDKNRLN